MQPGGVQSKIWLATKGSASVTQLFRPIRRRGRSGCAVMRWRAVTRHPWGVAGADSYHRQPARVGPCCGVVAPAPHAFVPETTRALLPRLGLGALAQVEPETPSALGTARVRAYELKRQLGALARTLGWCPTAGGLARLVLGRRRCGRGGAPRSELLLPLRVRVWRHLPRPLAPAGSSSNAAARPGAGSATDTPGASGFGHRC